MMEYWRKEGDAWDSYYRGVPIFSPRRWVSAFLRARTRVILPWVQCDAKSAVLDVGCGSGVQMRLLAPRCGRIVGIDCSQQMVDIARRELGKLTAGSWELRLGDAESLPFQDGSFDWIVCLGVLDYLASTRRALSECRRVLKEGGHIVFTIPKRPSAFAFLRTSLGLAIRRRLFGLPAISNAVTESELRLLVSSQGFQLLSLRSLWTTMWIVRAKRA